MVERLAMVWGSANEEMMLMQSWARLQATAAFTHATDLCTQATGWSYIFSFSLRVPKQSSVVGVLTVLPVSYDLEPSR